MTVMQTPLDFSAFPWMRSAFYEYGQHEIRGPAENAHVHRYFATVHVRNARDDGTPWCSAFANWCMNQAGISGSGRADAKSWLGWGAKCLAKPSYGAIAVLWRDSPASWHGHVAFYVGETSHQLWLLGGNQGTGAVSIKGYAKARLLGYRWPAGYPVPDENT